MSAGELIRECGQLRAHEAIMERDGTAVARQCLGDAAPDAPAAAGDKSNTAEERAIGHR